MFGSRSKEGPEQSPLIPSTSTLPHHGPHCTFYGVLASTAPVYLFWGTSLIVLSSYDFVYFI